MQKNASAKVKVIRVLPPKEDTKGVKALIQLPGEQDALLKVGFDGQLAEKIKASVGKCLALSGTFRFRKEVPLPVFEVNGELESKMVVSGRLTRDAELKYSQNGKAYTAISIAVDYGWGEQKETDFINCTIFGNDKERNAAVVLAEQGQKGRQITVVGKLDQNKSEEGKVYTKLIIEDYQLGPAKKDAPAQPKAQDQAHGESQYDDWSSIGLEIDENDIDF